MVIGYLYCIVYFILFVLFVSFNQVILFLEKERPYILIPINAFTGG